MDIARVAIRRATLEDAEGMSGFMNALADEGLDTITGLRPTVEEEKEFLEKASSKERALFLLAVDSRLVVGMLDLWAGEKRSTRHTGRLGMSVLKPYRNRGVGRRLLEAAIQEAKRWEDFCRIELDVAPWNAPALRLYQSAGFAREGIKNKAIDFRGKPEDLVLMALTW